MTWVGGSNIQCSRLAAWHCEEVKTCWHDKKSHSELSITPSIASQGCAGTCDPQPYPGVDPPDGDGGEDPPGPDQVCQPGRHDADQPLQQVAQGGKEPSKWETVAQHIGEVCC